MLTDKQPHAMLYSFDQRFPEAGKASIMTQDISVHHPGLRSLQQDDSKEEMTITRVRGNVIVELDGGSATQRLLQRVKMSGSPGGKDARYFLAWDQGGRKVGEILSGDPGRGAMAIDTVEDLTVGMRVRWMVTDGDGVGKGDPSQDKSWRLEVTDPEGLEQPSGPGVGSENGLLIGAAYQRSWTSWWQKTAMASRHSVL
ncbi:hypothetical protein BJ684DRAFT_21611 [Piptocephalis cylindrospora]|uniref:Uncharacterized protein n=1 Tax=Piptocephalis cylindrospora TaxID=1907219 RepID=A0A4P9XZF1_9FUNG|nr:hypothetical protein BJ684DRAFT_21611 [Piptocephalis cylindrospora]|eukprot:RKP11815.1 hypothetical protein BJ684DRAFT_21611 [Piptocephalis cylindrospora]